jgi:hypothetical protein
MDILKIADDLDLTGSFEGKEGDSSQISIQKDKDDGIVYPAIHKKTNLNKTLEPKTVIPTPN